MLEHRKHAEEMSLEQRRHEKEMSQAEAEGFEDAAEDAPWDDDEHDFWDAEEKGYGDDGEWNEADMLFQGGSGAMPDGAERPGNASTRDVNEDRLREIDAWVEAQQQKAAAAETDDAAEESPTFIPLGPTFNAAEANFANIARHNAQKEKRQCCRAQQSGYHQQGSFDCVSQHEGPIASPAEKPRITS